MPEESLEEMKSKDRKLFHSMLVSSGEPASNLGKIIACDNFSSLQRLLRVTAYVMKFVNILKYKIKKLEEQPAMELTAHDLTRSEILWVKDAQRALTKEKKLDTWTKQLGLFLYADGTYRYSPCDKAPHINF